MPVVDIRKREKDCKKALTKGGWFGILTKLSARWRLCQRVGRKNHLTAATRCGNLSRLPQMTRKRKFRTPRKKFLTKLYECGKLKKLLLIQNGSGVKKLLKKVLDKRNEVMYNNNVPPEAACTL